LQEGSEVATDAELVLRFVDDLTDFAVVMLDPQGRILTWNAGARALLGYSSEEIVGRNFSELYSKAELMTANSSAALRDALQWGRHETVGRLSRKDGGNFQARVLVRPLSDDQQRLAGFGLLVTDVEGAARRPVMVRPESMSQPVVPLPSSARILVVDDNGGVLAEAVEMLTDLGYGVLSASNGAEALALLERAPDVDLLFTDVVMPGEVSGRALGERAMQLRPGLKVLFASGYFEGALVTKGELETDVHFLAKPYRMRELAQKIEDVLSRPS
jgi:PAS domain S-box-containing protein